MPYLIIPDAAALLQFVQEVLGAEEKMLGKDADGNWRHCEVWVGKSVLMFSQTTGDFGANTAGLYVYVADVDAAYQKALSLGATALMPVGDQPYGRSGGVRDTNGNTWWLVTAPQQ